MVTDQQTYVLQLMADGEVERASMQVRGCNDDFSLLIRAILDRWDDEIQNAVEDEREAFEPEWADCPNCEEKEQDAETLQTELDDLTEEVEDLKKKIKKGHCPKCTAPEPVAGDHCRGGLRVG